MVDVIAKIIPREKYPIKCPYSMKPTRVVIHNTANDASAENEIAYMGRNNNEVSFHYAVDDVQAIQGIPENLNAWHAGDGHGKGNMEGIAIEICYSKSGGERFEKAERNAAELTASILKRYGWGMEQVTKHQDYSGKYCPHRTLDMGWERFLDMVRGYLEEDAEEEQTAGQEPAKEAPEEAKPLDTQVAASYRVKTAQRGWLPEVKDLEDYAGVTGQAVTDIAIGVSQGTVKYRVHVKGGGWLPYVTGYDIGDYNNGYAGNGKPIDAVEVYYSTPDSIRPYKKAKYRVAPVGGDYYSWQYDNEKTDGQDGYAGLFGKTIDKFQMVVE